MAGTYTDIVNLIVPEEVSPGTLFSAEALVKNLSAVSLMVYVSGDANGTPIDFGGQIQLVNPGVIASFVQYMYMPAVGGVAITAITKVKIGDVFIEDDTATASIGEVPAGSIIDKWVNKGSEGNSLAMPANVDANGETFEIGVKWQNTSQSAYLTRVEIMVRDPAGLLRGNIVSQYYNMPAQGIRENNWNVDIPGGAAAYVDKAGMWAISIKIVLDSGTVIDSFDGYCMNASGLLGNITGMWFNQGSHVQLPFGSQIEADNQWFEVGVRYKNSTQRTVIAGVQVEVWDPDNLKQQVPAVDYTGMGPNDEFQTEYQFGEVNKVGNWTVKLKFIERDTGIVIDEWPLDTTGILFEAIPEASISEVIINSYTPAVVEPGNTIIVNVSFKYTVPSPVTITLMAALHIMPGIDYPTYHDISLDAGTDIVWTGDIEIPITDTVGLTNDTYHLLVSIEGTSASYQVDNAITCTNMSAGVGDLMEMVGGLIVVMMMSMMMNMMSSPEGFMAEAGKKIEQVEKIAGPLVQIFTREKED